jgi:plastocyanin
MHHPSHPAGTRPPRNLTTRPVSALLAIAALAVAQLACGSGARSNDRPPAATHLPAADGTVSVDARLLGFTLSADTAEAGPVTFVVSNDDFLPHDFELTGNGINEKTDRLNPGESDTLTLDLTAGTYTYICTVEGHSENMRGTFTVE